MKTTDSTPATDHEILETLFLMTAKILKETQQKKSSDLDLYDNADLKIKLNCSTSTLYRMRKNKQIPFKKIRGKFYYPKSFFYKAFKI